MQDSYDVVIIGAGIMGLLSAYELIKVGSKVALIDQARVGNKTAASSGITRSLRNDYENPVYSVLARQAWDKWQVLEDEIGQKLTINSGCLNITTQKSRASYALRSLKWLERDKNPFEEFSDVKTLTKHFPQFSQINYAVLDIEAGVGLASKTLDAVCELLKSYGGCEIFEDTSIRTIYPLSKKVLVDTDRGIFEAKKAVLCAGMGTPDLVTKIKGSTFRFELTPERPVESVYYIPENPGQYFSERLPVFAELDLGIYGHPIVDGITKGVKIGMYLPPQNINKNFQRTCKPLSDFVERYMPELARDSAIKSVTETDQCSYDMTADDNFVVGSLPGFTETFLAAGFCGTGYKFAPIIAELVSDFYSDRKFRYDISQFNPARFKV